MSWGDDFGAQANRFIILNLTSNNELNAEIRSAGAHDNRVTAPALSEGQWHHIAFVRSLGNTLTLFVDGALAASDSDGSFQGAIDFGAFERNVYLGSKRASLYSADQSDQAFRGRLAKVGFLFTTAD